MTDDEPAADDDASPDDDSPAHDCSPGGDDSPARDGSPGDDDSLDHNDSPSGDDPAADDVPPGVRERIEADPYCQRLGIELVALGPGTAETRLAVGEHLLNFHGTPHGGAVYSLADAAFAAASNSHGETALALETNISYLDAVDAGTTLTARAEETHLTRRTAEYAVVVETAGGERVATFRGRVYRP